MLLFVLKIERLIQWQTAARSLIVENEELRRLLSFVPDDVAKSVTARVIGEIGRTFVRNILINADDWPVLLRGKRQ